MKTVPRDPSYRHVIGTHTIPDGQATVRYNRWIQTPDSAGLTTFRERRRRGYAEDNCHPDSISGNLIPKSRKPS
jgi:hypothetical protein